MQHFHNKKRSTSLTQGLITRSESSKLVGRSNSLAGFTLVEIMVSSILLAIIVAGIFSITLSTKKIISVSNQRYTATEVAKTVLDNLRAYLGDDNWSLGTSPIYPTGGWSSWYSLSDYSTPLSSRVSGLFDGSELDTQYMGGWRYRIINESPYDYRKAEVEVNWSDVEL
jgi:prepilin-type N-terminal cleavage/methylation domain-containing protein